MLTLVFSADYLAGPSSVQTNQAAGGNTASESLLDKADESEGTGSETDSIAGTDCDFDHLFGYMSTADTRHEHADLEHVLDKVDQSLWSNQSAAGRQALFDQIISSIDYYLTSRPRSDNCRGPTPVAWQPAAKSGATQSNASGPPSLGKGSANPGSHDHSTKKRDREDHNRSQDDDENDDREPGRGSKRVSRSDAANPSRFACPYLKRFPLIYRHWRHCLNGWPSVHRLK